MNRIFLSLVTLFFALIVSGDGRTQTKIDHAAVNGNANDHGKFEILVRQYIGLVNSSDRANRSKLFIDTPASYVRFRYGSANRPSKAITYGKLVAPVAMGDEQDSTAESNFNRDYVIDFFPKVFKRNNLRVKQFRESWSNRTEGRIRIEFGKDGDDASSILMDFYLTTAPSGEWKIFQISVSRASETYPVTK